MPIGSVPKRCLQKVSTKVMGRRGGGVGEGREGEGGRGRGGCLMRGLGTDQVISGPM